MVVDRVTLMGCAITRFRETKLVIIIFYSSYLVCNYAGAQKANYPIYKHGTATSKCKTGTNPDYPNLCSIYEQVNHDVRVDDYEIIYRKEIAGTTFPKPKKPLIEIKEKELATSKPEKQLSAAKQKKKKTRT